MKGLCDQMQDLITDQVLGLLGRQQQDMLLKHIKQCVACAAAMRETEEKHELLSDMGSRFKADMPDRIDRCFIALNQTETEPRAKWIIQWRHIMARPITKIAVAAVIIIAIVLAVSFLDKSVTTAYAIEQTVEACRSLRFIHLKTEPARKGGNGIDEMWAEFDADGTLLRLRMNFSNSADGPKDVIWQEGKAEVWFKAKKSTVVVREKNMLARLKMSYRDFDPKVLGEELCRNQAQDANQITINESNSDDDPITITRTRKGFRTVFKVDLKTNLLQQIENYVLKNGEYEFQNRTIYLDYNQPIDPSIFVFDPPSDVVRTDQTTQEVGIAKGALSDEESAVEVTRQFIQALADKDYTKAGKLYGGFPGARLKELLAEIESIRLVSVGKPEPHPETGGLRVPCQIEWGKDGQTMIESTALNTRQVHGQPDRWQVIGGF